MKLNRLNIIIKEIRILVSSSFFFCYNFKVVLLLLRAESMNSFFYPSQTHFPIFVLSWVTMKWIIQLFIIDSVNMVDDSALFCRFKKIIGPSLALPKLSYWMKLKIYKGQGFNFSYLLYTSIELLSKVLNL